MKKWEYEEVSTSVINIILILSWLIFLPIIIGVYHKNHELSIILLILLFIISLICLPFYLIKHNKRKKYMQIVEHCDFKTCGKVSRIIEIKHDNPNPDPDVIDGYITTWTRHFVVEYRDANNMYQSFTTPTISMQMKKYTNLDNLVCDVYVKGNDVFARNFSEVTNYSNQTLEVIDTCTKEKNLIKRYKLKKNIWLTIMVLWVTIGITLSLFLFWSKITLGAVFIGGIFCYLIYDMYEVEIHRLDTGYYKQGVLQRCQHCGHLMSIPFNQMEQYVNLPKDNTGIRIVNCPSCKKTTQLLSFDSQYKSYKKYLEQINK